MAVDYTEIDKVGRFVKFCFFKICGNLKLLLWNANSLNETPIV